MMNAPPLIRPLQHVLRGRLSTSRRPIQNVPLASQRRFESSEAAETESATTTLPDLTQIEDPIFQGLDPRLPRAVQALHLKPLRREVQYGVPTADLQLRSYSVRSLEFFADFALRAAYYCNLPAFGPVPLPRIIERWTVPKSSFIFKKSQENFERITLRRLIQIRDGHPESVQIWLAFLRKHAYAGVGMKANVWEFSKLGVGEMMDKDLESFRDTIEPKWKHLGGRRELGTVEKVEELLTNERFRAAGGR